MTPREFFQRDPVTCARDLIGCTLLWENCSGIIVETEAYAAEGDPACHTASRPSTRAFIAEHPAGSAYVYFNYGMHWMLNILTKHDEGDGLILIRAVQPLSGIEEMTERRSRRIRKAPAHDRWLCSGPGKLAAAFGITRDDHGSDLCGRILPAPGPAPILATPRIGISKAQDFPWRFILRDSRYITPGT